MVLNKNRFISPVSLDADVLSGYLTANRLVFPETEGRIKFVPTVSNETTSTPSPTGNPIIVHTCPGTGVSAACVMHISLSVTFLGLCAVFALWL